MSAVNASAPWASPRFKRLAFLLTLGCLVSAIGLPIIVAVVWFVMPAPDLFTHTLKRAPVDPEALTAWLDWSSRAIGLALTLVPTAFSVAALFRARTCLALFAKGIRFDQRVVAALRGFSGMTFLSMITGIVVQGPVTALLTYYRGPGHREIAFGVGTQEIYELFFAATVWLIATVMAEAVEIARENSEFV